MRAYAYTITRLFFVRWAGWCGVVSRSNYCSRVNPFGLSRFLFSRLKRDAGRLPVFCQPIKFGAAYIFFLEATPSEMGYSPRVRVTMGFLWFSGGVFFGCGGPSKVAVDVKC